jgi:adenylate cyclase
MQFPLRALVGLGVTADWPHAEQRRVRTINVVALIAFFATGLFAVVFLPSRPARISLAVYVFELILYLAGYAATLVLNRMGHHDTAVVVLLSAGIGNIVGVNLTVGLQTGVAVFLVTVAIGAVLLTRPEQRLIRWFFVAAAAVAYAVLVAVDPPVSEEIKGSGIVPVLQIATYSGMVAFVITVVWFQRRFADRAEDALAEANELSERLLLNILPPDIAERLKADEYPIADRKSEVTVLFADIVGSTALAEQLAASDLVATLDALFSSFDEIADKHGLEKIKTVGDSYFAVAGLTPDSNRHASAAADAALAMRTDLANHQFPGIGRVQMRFGIHTGPVVAGVIGKRKFSYDVWGDTVNTASRMESTSEPDMIQVSEATYYRLQAQYRLRSRGHVPVPGKGELATYELIGRKSRPDNEMAPPAG